MAVTLTHFVFFLLGDAVASPDSPTLTPTPKPTQAAKRTKAAKPSTRPIATSPRLTRTGEPIYPSRRMGAALAKRKTRAELEAYRRRLERDWDKEVARREKGDEQIASEQVYLWRRMGRPWGAPFRNFIEDRAPYGDPSLGQ